MDERASALLTGLDSDQSTMEPRDPSRSPSPSVHSPPSSAECNEQSSSPTTTRTSLPTNSELSSANLSLEPSTPAADGDRHPKGKRKRTALKDKEILENAYSDNPKPDKVARLDIVKRVSLSEKEVQIWFQNRRQNDRRKSRPLSPQELAALRFGGMVVSPGSRLFNSSFGSDTSNLTSAPNMPPPELAASSLLQSDPAAFNSSFGDEVEGGQEIPQEPRSWEERATAPGAESSTPVSSEREPRQQLSRSFSGSIGYLSNRWNAASSFSTPSPFSRDDSFRPETFSSSCPPSTTPGSVLPRPGSQSSRFRLSMSLEGKAEVVSSNSSPPQAVAAPPTPDALQSLGHIRRPELQRSYSASGITLPPLSMLTNSIPLAKPRPLPPRLTRGRSRDVNAWEFCCDSENREDALTVQAKHESSGSAIAAISLLRTTSSTSGSPLQASSSAKRKSSMSKAAPRAGQAKKPKLSRATSSMARMQNTLGPSDRHNIQRDFVKLSSKPNGTPLVFLSGHDSDKENWSPDEDGNRRASSRQAQRNGNTNTNPTPSGRRPLPSGPSKLDGSNRKFPRRTPARVLQDARSSAFFANRANTAPSANGYRRGKRATSPLEIYEDDDAENASSVVRLPVLDDEVERFMRGEVSPSKKGDVDAVAGLLSLSQGAWR